MFMSLFPFKKIRPQQDILLNSARETISKKGILLVHAPTGLGKTAAVISPALEHALKEGKKVIFLTSRNTQHRLVADTIKLINKEKNLNISYTSIFGKKWLCLQKNIQKLSQQDFMEFCKSLCANDNCIFYKNMKNGDTLSIKAQQAIKTIEVDKKFSENIKNVCEYLEVCPYEITMMMARNANVIIMDYQYMFNPTIRDIFLKKTDSKLEDCIIVCDEGHNLPDRLKNLASDKLSTTILNRALHEIKEHRFLTEEKLLIDIGKELVYIIKDMNEEGLSERYITKEEFLSIIEKVADPKKITIELQRLAEIVREERKHSYLGSIAEFISKWIDADEIHFTRIISISKEKKHIGFSISLSCLDPSIIAQDILSNSYSTIIMSGTLLPIQMYKVLLGIDSCDSVVLNSPFPKENKNSIIVPFTSTRFKTRDDEMYKRIALILSKIVEAIKGNCAAFFPSYQLLERVFNSFKSEKEVIVEKKILTKDEKEKLLNYFKSKKDEGAVMFAVIRGNFGEGIDLPGDFLNGVIIVGLPLDIPDLETKSLINYYEEKFGKGWLFGYIYPAFNRIIQSAGRCIRTEKDKGVIIFLDERYAWPQYREVLEEFTEVKVSKDYIKEINNFFS